MNSSTSILQGVGVGRKAVIGPVAKVADMVEISLEEPVLRDGEPVAREQLPDLVAAAFQAVTADLQAQARSAKGALAEVLTATSQIAADPALVNQSIQAIEQGAPPVAAISQTVESFITLFEQIGGLMADRVTDLRSVRDRVIASLLQHPMPGVPQLDEPSVIVARDLAPADTAALDLDLVLGIVTELGGPTGHTAIIAGQLGIPCLVQVRGAMELEEGTPVALDSSLGQVIINPGTAVTEKIEKFAQFAEITAKDAEPGGTSDGHAVDLLVNIGTAADATRAATQTDGHIVAGSGLFRTEVLFLEASSAPDVASQTKAYTEALKAFGSRKVVVRTLDAGADKPLAFASQPDEENPALGVRGYRTDRIHPGILEDQLRALAQAGQAASNEPWVMAPMIATAAEAREFSSKARAAGLSTVGVMVEVPAAALRARDLLQVVDFVSIGTNDLAQYTMATDRLRGELADLLDIWQPAVLDLIRLTASAGREQGKPVGVCGESAADPLMALVLTGMGVTSLSMSLGAVPAVRYALRKHTLAKCEQMAAAALGARSADEAREKVVSLLSSEVATYLA